MSKTKGAYTHIIPMEEIEKLASIGATNREMADWFGCSLPTFERRIAEEQEHIAVLRGRAKFAMSLRRRQAQAADEGNVTMLVWLGKNVLGQRDNIDTRLTGGGPNGEVEMNVSATELLQRGIDRVNARRLTEGDSGLLTGGQEA